LLQVWVSHQRKNIDRHPLILGKCLISWSIISWKNANGWQREKKWKQSSFSSSLEPKKCIRLASSSLSSQSLQSNNPSSSIACLFVPSRNAPSLRVWLVQGLDGFSFLLNCIVLKIKLQILQHINQFFKMNRRIRMNGLFCTGIVCRAGPWGVQGTQWNWASPRYGSPKKKL